MTIAHHKDNLPSKTRLSFIENALAKAHDIANDKA
jgi:hypothetical protein